MKFKETLKNFFVSVKEGTSRFLIAFVCSVLCFLTATYHIIFEPDAMEIMFPLYMTFALTAVFSVLLKTLQEYIFEKINRIIQYILCAVVAVVGFILLKLNYESLYSIMAYTGIMIAMPCFIFFTLMQGENRDTAFAKIVSSLIFTSAVCGVLSAGLSTCYAAFDLLIFSWNDDFKVYLILNLFVWIVGFTNIFLSFIPKKDVAIQPSKLFRTFVLFAGLPLYILLIAILLVYLAKIVVTWNMPVGEINWFASFASLFFIFFLLSVRQYPEKLAKLFVKYGGYCLIPVLIMQAIAVFERINAYGLTTPRTVSLVLIFISVLFIIGSIVVPKHLNKIAFASGIIVLIVTLTPLNVIDMPVKSQTNILKSTLIANNMLQNGTVVPNADISKEDKNRIISSYNYLKYSADTNPDFIPDTDKSIYEILGITDDTEANYIYCYYSTANSVDITEFSTMIEVSVRYEFLEFEHNATPYTIDLTEVAQSLYDQYGQKNSDLGIYMIDENMGLYLRSFSFGKENNELLSPYFDGFVLIK